MYFLLFKLNFSGIICNLSFCVICLGKFVVEFVKIINFDIFIFLIFLF